MAIAVATFEIYGWKFKLNTEQLILLLAPRSHWWGVKVPRECLHEKTRTSASFMLGWLFYFVSCLHYDKVISNLEGTLQVDKIHVRFKIANMHMRYLFQSTRRLISHRNLWSFRVYMILLRDLVRSEILAPVQQPGWTYARVTRAGMTCCGGIM